MKKFKFLKRLDNGDYEITCHLPLDLQDGIDLSKEIKKLLKKEVWIEDSLHYNPPVIRIATFERPNRKVFSFETEIWDTKRKSFLTFGTLSKLEEKFLEIEKEAGAVAKMYIILRSKFY